MFPWEVGPQTVTKWNLPDDSQEAGAINEDNHQQETARLAVLKEYNILDTPEETAFDDIVRLAAYICGTPIALITLVDETRQWFKARIGTNVLETARDISFCIHALKSDSLFVIPDATQDQRFANNPFVTDDPQIRFYAGMPLTTTTGYGLGTLCVLDRVPRFMTIEQQEALTTLGRSVMALLEQRRLLEQADCAEKQAKESAAAFAAVLNSSVDAIIRFLPNGRILDWNPAATALFGCSREEALQMSWQDLLPTTDSAYTLTADHIVRHTALHTQRLETPLKCGGKRFLAEVTLTTLPGIIKTETGTISTHFCAFVRDVTQQRKAEEELRTAHDNMEIRVAQRTEELLIQQQFLRRVLDTDPNFIFVKNVDGIFTLANAAVAEAYGTTPERLIGKRDVDFNPRAEEVQHFGKDDAEVLRTGKDKFIAEEKVTDAAGRTRWMQTIKRPLPSPDGITQELLGISTDITDRKAAEAALLYQAFHDTLTGLPNRALFVNRLERAVEQMKRTQEQIAVLFLDLDNFKVINDSLGHDAGDALLKEVAERLLSCVRPGDTVARIGGDEFTFLLENLGSHQDAVSLAERIADVLSEPFPLSEQGRDTRMISITTSIGITISSSGENAASDLLRYADTAMYEAKIAGKSSHAVFLPSMNDRAMERLEMEIALRQAIEQEQLRLFYQPIVNLVTQRVEGVEALVRWQHPQRGMISPDKFIPIAEETGLILPLGRWVIREACGQAKAWQEKYPEAPLEMGVNLSARQLQQVDLVSEITVALEKSNLSPHRLKLEITESVVMHDVKGGIEKLRALRSLGVRLAIDDFGTGYSSMAYLYTLPINTLKIDQAFVSRISKQNEDTAVVRAIVSLAKELDLEIICEGIETEKQYHYLKHLGCNQGQGYYFSRPLSAKAMEELLQTKIKTEIP